ncbi:MAG: O-antigen ligase family protein [Candidatus Saccharimonadales bacterium]
MKSILRLKTDRLANYLVAVVLVLVPFHAFLTVWGSTLLGHYTTLRLWDDVLLGVLVIVVSGWLVRDKSLRNHLFGSLLFRLIALYVVLTFGLGLVAFTKHEVTAKALGYALLVNLRFLVWFLAVWAVATRSNWLRAHWKQFVFWPLLLVVIFAVLQCLVLPHDFLTHFGYDKTLTIAPTTTINQNTNTIRAQSFLRGPNPLGAYLVVGFGLLATMVAFSKRAWRTWALGGLASLALLLSFSRSAWIGAFVAVVVALWLRLHTKRARYITLTVTGLILIIFAGSLAIFHKNSGVQDAVFHVNAGSTANVTSNAGHASAFKSGLRDITHEPFGRGPGTAGPASWYNTEHSVRNSENYFLEIGQEVGWAGLIVFITINVALGFELWSRRGETLVLGVFASLIGLSLLNQFAYGWADDTLAYLWWGLAGIALAPKSYILKSRPSSDETKTKTRS